jgi:hypothetical protein
VHEILLIKKLLEMGETDFVVGAIDFCLLEFETGRDRVLVKHADCIE